MTLKIFIFTEKFITDAWTKLRENFRKCLNRRKKASKSGASGKQLSTCQFFKELSFLLDVIGVKTTYSNIRPDIFTPPASPVDRHSISPPMTRKSFPPTATISSAVGNVPSSPLNPPAPSPTSTLPQVSTMTTTTITTPRNNKRKQATEPVQSALERAIMADIDKSKETEVEKNDPDELFCKSIVSSFKGLTKKKNKQAKIKVLQVLLDMEDSDDDTA